MGDTNITSVASGRPGAIVRSHSAAFPMAFTRASRVFARVLVGSFVGLLPALLAACSSDTGRRRVRVTRSEGLETEQETVARGAPLLEGMGDLHHEVSTDDELAQRYFDQGLVLHYGFNHAEAARSFRAAAQLDPDCAMCWIGLGITLGPNINTPRDPNDVPEVDEAIQRALAAKEKVTPRERAYVEAVSRRWVDRALEDRSRLDEAYAEAMGEVAATYPDDPDAAALFAEALMVLHPWDYWKANGEPQEWTPKILGTLEALIERAPRHPFAHHLYIHAVEASPEPERGLPSARVLGDLVPGAGHLVHMPSHIYINTGDYSAASRANERAVLADERYLRQVEEQGLYALAYYPHNYHFLWATTTLEGRSERALEAARAVAARADREKMREPRFGTLQHFLSIPYFALVSFGRWDEALAEPMPDVDLVYPETMWRYMRGMALASTGELELAREARQAVAEAAHDSGLEGVTIWDINDTRDLVRIAEAILAGRIAEMEQRFVAAAGHYRRAVRLEDRLAYDEPPPWGPATRRYLGRALMKAERYPQAEAAYREDLERFPENGWSLFGLAQSLRAQGKPGDAEAVQERFEEVWEVADVDLRWSAF